MRLGKWQITREPIVERRVTATARRYWEATKDAGFAFPTFVDTVYLSDLDYFEKSSHNYATYYGWAQWGAIIFSSITTVILSAQLMTGFWRVAGPVASVLATLATAAISTFKWQEKWSNAHATRSALDRELYLFSAGLDAYDKKSATERQMLFVTNVTQILSAADDRWQAAHRPDAQAPNGDPHAEAAKGTEHDPKSATNEGNPPAPH